MQTKTCNSITHCTSTKRTVFRIEGYNILQCQSCGHRYTIPHESLTHIQSVYSDKYFFGGAAGYPNYLEEKEILLQHGSRYATIISRYVNTPGTMLDVGCASGFILKGFEKKGWKCKGIEPNETMAKHGINEMGLDIQVGNLETFETGKKFDLITLIQVIGHFQDIDHAMMNAHKILKHGGIILVESWNRNSLIAKLMGRRWHEYSPPSVIHWFSDKTLENLFNYYGFDLVDKGRPIKQISVKHALSLVESKLPLFALNHKSLNIVRNAIGKWKVIYPPIDIKWYIFQKQFA